jgi:hypothetical protein
MPGPNSSPQARSTGGGIVEGKTALKNRGLTSGQGFEYQSKAEGKTKGTGKKKS